MRKFTYATCYIKRMSVKHHKNDNIKYGKKTPYISDTLKSFSAKCEVKLNLQTTHKEKRFNPFEEGYKSQKGNRSRYKGLFKATYPHIQLWGCEAR